MTTYYPQLLSSRILRDSDRSSVSASDNAIVGGWVVTDKFILATCIGYNGRDTAASAYKLQWRNVTASGSFADVAATGEIKYAATSAVLADGTALTSGNARCSSQSGTMTWQNGLENVADNLLPDSTTLDLGSDCYTELQWALDPAGALVNNQYEFRLWNNTSAATVGTCGATLKFAILVSGPVQSFGFIESATQSVVVLPITITITDEDYKITEAASLMKEMLIDIDEGELEGYKTTDIVGAVAGGPYFAWGASPAGAGDMLCTWQEWRHSDGSVATNSGDFGALTVNQDCFSPVVQMPSGSKLITLYKDKYATGSGTVHVYVRGDTSTFAWDAGSPSWTEYTTAITQSWTYIQMKLSAS
jgi:hypothetical protein